MVQLSQAPKASKRLGIRIVSEINAINKKKHYFSILSFLVPTICHLKCPCNKLKEPCQVADSIINKTCVSPGLPCKSRGLSASSIGSQQRLSVPGSLYKGRTKKKMLVTWPSGPGEAQVCDHGWSLLGVGPPRLFKGIGPGRECRV